jgi:hypothetical protein
MAEFYGQLSRRFPGLDDHALVYGSKGRGEAGRDRGNMVATARRLR